MQKAFFQKRHREAIQGPQRIPETVDLKAELDRLRLENQQLKASLKNSADDMSSMETLLEDSQTSYWEWSSSEASFYISPSLKRMLAYDVADLPTSLEIWRLIAHPKDFPNLINFLKGKWQTADKNELSLRLYCKCGSTIWVRLKARITKRDENGQALKVVGTATNIMETMEAMEFQDHFFELSTEMFCVADFDGYFKRLNSVWEKVLGYSAEELMAQPFLTFVHPDDHEKTRKAAESLANGNPLNNFVNRYITKKGDNKWISFSATPVVDESKIYAVARDITLDQKIQEILVTSEEGYRTLFDFAPIGIAQLDLDGKIQMSNRNLEKILGFSGKELLEREFATLANIRDYQEIKDLFKEVAFQQSGRSRLESRFNHRDGFLVWGNITFSLVPKPGGNPDMVIAMIEDISPRKCSEFALYRKNEELERSNNELEQFAYIASHDLQEPLRTVSNFMQLLEKETLNQLPEKSQTYVRFVIEASQRMQTLLDSLLSFSRIGKEKGRPGEVDCNKVMDSVVKNLSAMIDEKNALVEYHHLPMVYGHEAQLIQLFQNLVANGIKFKGEEPPRIVVEAIEKNSFCEISVRDNGIGIEPRFFDQIFDVFQRLHDRSQYPGAGIGLSVCKKIADLHQGHIKVSSTPGKGTTFKLTIPSTRSINENVA